MGAVVGRIGPDVEGRDAPRGCQLGGPEGRFGLGVCGPASGKVRDGTNPSVWRSPVVQI